MYEEDENILFNAKMNALNILLVVNASIRHRICRALGVFI